MTKKLLEIFKPGTHTAMAGQALSFAEADLAATIAAYDPAKHEAPLVVGHPTINAPAYGWVKSLSFADGAMLAEPDQVDVAFAEMVNSGKFKKISASFYLPTAPNNPVPGVYYLRHVGFLGAQPPAVKGLKSASFTETEDGVVEFGDWADQVEAGLFRSLREWIIGKFSLDDADKALPSYDVNTVEGEAARPDPAAPGVCGYCGNPCCDCTCNSSPGLAGSQFSEEQKESPTMLTSAQIAAKEVEFAERETKLKLQETTNRHTEHLSFAEALVKEAKLLPALKEQTVAMLDFAAGLEGTSVVEFGEGDGKKSQPLVESFKAFLSGQPKIVEFGEVAGGEVEGDTTASFAAAPGYTVDATSLETHNKALAYQTKNPGTEYMTAVKAVS
jgi:hypothetical protein